MSGNGDVSPTIPSSAVSRDPFPAFWTTISCMKLESIGEVIAARTLFLANDPSQKVVVQMGKPQPLPDALGDAHYCPYQISGAGMEKIFYGAGVDAFQALELGLNNDWGRSSISQRKA
jgi:hypothetical protein